MDSSLLDPAVRDYYLQRETDDSPPPAGDAAPGAGHAMSEPPSPLPGPVPPPAGSKLADSVTQAVQALRANAPQPDLEGLKSAQAADVERERQMAFGRSGASALGLLTGRAPDYTGLVPDQLNVRNWVSKQQEMDRAHHLGNEELRNAAYLAHWLGRDQTKQVSGMDDPADPVSKAARDAFRATAQGTQVAESMGGDYEKLSASQIVQISKVKADHAVKAADAPLDDVDRSELTKRGINPALPKSHGEAVALIQHYESTKAAASRAEHGGHNGNRVDVVDLADAVERGEASPRMTDYGRITGPALAAELSRRKFNTAKAEREWLAETKTISSLNSTQQTQQRQAIGALQHQLDLVDQAYDKWQQVGPASGYRALNKLALGTAKQGGGDAGAAAQILEGQIADLVSELSNVYMKGGVPTDHALDLAKKNLSAEWNERTFKDSLAMLRRAANIRLNVMAATTPAGTEGNRYHEAPPAASSGKPNDPMGIR